MNRLLETALASPSPRAQADRMYTVVKYTCYLGLPIHLFFIPLFYSLHVPLLALFNVFSCFAWIGAWVLNRRGLRWAAINLLSAEVVIHAVVATVMLGWRSGFHAPLMPLICGIMINHRVKTRTTFSQAGALLVLYSVLFAATKDYVAPGVSPLILDALSYMHIVIVFAGLSVVSYFFREASLRAEKRMEDLATTDQLTRLANRHKMRELLEREVSRSDRTNRAFSLLLTDIDHFKRINDTYGHDVGDYVLRTIGTILKDAARTHDSVSRWGGEEFLVLLPETELAGAIDAAERLRVAVEQQTFEDKGKSFKVTMTFGVAVHGTSEDVEETIKRADRGLYAGKGGGRNRVVAYGTEAHQVA